MSGDVRTGQAPLEHWYELATAELEDSAHLRRRVAEQVAAPAVELWLVRHGETTTNAAGLFTGTTDAPLTVRGRLQAQDAGRRIAGRTFDIGFTSNLTRSIETLALAARAGGLEVPCIAQDARLAERSYGELERTPIRPRDPRLAVDLSLEPPGGESYVALTRRCLSFLLDVRRLAARLRHPLTVIVSTHMGPLRVLTSILDETTDPVVVRGLMFDNGAVVQRALRTLAWPAFAGGLPEPEAPAPVD
jgi:broad specificity phosphatase PhoE